MTVVPYIVAYLGVAVFAIAIVARFFMWSRMPMHLRWELYPVAHEAPDRVKHGGSYYELPQWWKKPRETSLAGELSAMIPEMVFLVALREHNPKLWNRSFPFHFGLYLTAGCTALMVLGGLATAVAPGIMAGAAGTLLRYLIVVCGGAGLVLGMLGALGLLLRRLNSPALRSFSSPSDFFNLLLFIFVFGFACATWLLVDPGFVLVSGFVSNLVRFDMAPLAAGGVAAVLPALSAVFLSALLVYIPLTHMSHFVGKYFAYHAIRWNDAPNLQGGPEEPIINALLQRPITWAAPHIKGDGKKTWAEAATEETSK